MTLCVAAFGGGDDHHVAALSLAPISGPTLNLPASKASRDTKQETPEEHREVTRPGTLQDPLCGPHRGQLAAAAAPWEIWHQPWLEPAYTLYPFLWTDTADGSIRLSCLQFVQGHAVSQFPVPARRVFAGNA